MAAELKEESYRGSSLMFMPWEWNSFRHYAMGIAGGVEIAQDDGSFNVLDGIALDATGNLYVADFYSSKVLKMERAAASALTFDMTPQGSTSKDSSRTVKVENIGNAQLDFSTLRYPADFSMGDSYDSCNA